MTDLRRGWTCLIGGDRALIEMPGDLAVLAFEPDQAFTPEGTPLPVGAFSYEGTLAADFSRMHLDWTRHQSGFSEFPRNYEEILDGGAGYVDGVDSLTPAPRQAEASRRSAKSAHRKGTTIR